jgi:hypothetical protein
MGARPKPAPHTVEDGTLAEIAGRLEGVYQGLLDCHDERRGPRDEFTERRSWLLYVLENAVRDAASDLRRCSLRSKAGA